MTGSTGLWRRNVCDKIINHKKTTEAATRGVLCKKMLLETLQNSQENTCARVSFLIKLQASALQLY